MLYLTSNGNFGIEVVMEYCRSYRDAKNARNKSASQTSVDRVEHRKNEYRKNEYKCRSCGNQHPPRRCPAFGNTCSTCKGKNHYAAVCLSSRYNSAGRYRRQDEIRNGTATSPSNQYNEEQDSELDHIFLG